MTLSGESAPVRGARDLSEEQLARLAQVQARVQAVLDSYGYGRIDVPVLEHTDLYLRKLGSRVAARMFNVTDQRGERLSLRPEFTGSVIRSYIARGDHSSGPTRWQYAGAVFRDQEDPSHDVPRQFTQIGVELVGAPGPRADAELLGLACDGLAHLGLQGGTLVVGHAGLAPRLLEGLRLSDRVRMYLTSHMDLLHQGPTGMTALRSGLEEVRSWQGARPLGSGRPDVETPASGDLMGWLLSEGSARSTGRRNTADIVRRFRAKVQGADDPADLERAVTLLSRLAAVRAAPDAALSQGRTIVAQAGLDGAPLEDLAQGLESMEAFGSDGTSVVVDLGLTRALGYYTGIIFELYGPNGTATPVGGGGRYDGLVRALGGPDVPAMGFAYTLERILQALGTQAVLAVDPNNRVLVVPAEARDFAAAVAYAQQQRRSGRTCLLEFEPCLPAERLDRVRRTGSGRVALVSSAGVEEFAVSEEAAAYAAARTP